MSYRPHSLSVTFHARRLPHLYVPNHPIFVTWRLDGSLPGNRVFPREITSGKAFVAMDRLLDDARTGPVYLSKTEIAGVMAGAIHHLQDKKGFYALHAYVVMANHVHLLITPSIALPRIMHSLKGFTAKKANELLGREGRFWQDESYDRLVRDDVEFKRIERYIEMNPVKAGLVAAPEDFRLSSAWMEKAD